MKGGLLLLLLAAAMPVRAWAADQAAMRECHIPVLGMPDPLLAQFSAPSPLVTLAAAPAGSVSEPPLTELPRIVLRPITAEPRQVARPQSARAKPVTKPKRARPAPVANAPAIASQIAPKLSAAPAQPLLVALPASVPPSPTPLNPSQPGPSPASAEAEPTLGLPAVIGAVLQQTLPPPELPPPPEPQIQVTADADLGVAAYRHDDWAILVFDQRIPIEPSQLQPVGEAGELPAVQYGPASTVLTIPWPAGQEFSVAREGTSWLISAVPSGSGPGASVPRPVVPMPADRRIELRMESPGRVVTVIDPIDGRVLLAGTARTTAGGRTFVAQAARAPGYTVLESVLGFVVEPLADTIELRQSARGFVLSSANEDLSPGEAQAPPGLATTRRFDFPALPTTALARRLQAGLAAAAAAPPRARAQPRVAAAQSMISLGFGPEAQALLTVAALEDPVAAAEPDLLGLTAIAALLAGRVNEAQGLDLPALDGSAEIALWRMIGKAWRDGPITHDAALLPVALSYPAALQARLLPVLAEAAAAAEDDAALALIQTARPDLPGVQLAQATRLGRVGPAGPALALLDTVAAGSDRYASVRATAAAAELRLLQNELTPAQVADVLDRQALAWRGDRMELAWRLRAAALRTQAGAWRPALEGLRDTARLLPEGDAAGPQSEALRDRVGDVFRAMLAPGAPKVPPLDFIALSSEFAASLPQGEIGERLAATLADTLLALDLPLRARAVLKPFLSSTPPGALRAGIGARMAQLSLDAGAPIEAQAALAASNSVELPPGLVAERTLLEARALAARDNRAGALSLLTALGTPAADDLRATLFSQSGDWPAALEALTALVAKKVPAEGALPDEAQDIVLRQASAAVHCADGAVLASLREHALPRMDERRGGLLRLLTAPPVTGSADITRAGQELALSRGLPGRLQGLAAK